MSNLTERDAKTIFLHPLSINKLMYSDRQTINKPSQVYSQKSKEVMRSYPEYYYNEIVKFLSNSNNWYQ